MRGLFCRLTKCTQVTPPHLQKCCTRHIQVIMYWPPVVDMGQMSTIPRDPAQVCGTIITEFASESELDIQAKKARTASTFLQLNCLWKGFLLSILIRAG